MRHLTCTFVQITDFSQNAVFKEEIKGLIIKCWQLEICEPQG